jgi:hypothetical protein
MPHERENSILVCVCVLLTALAPMHQQADSLGWTRKKKKPSKRVAKSNKSKSMSYRTRLHRTHLHDEKYVVGVSAR